MNKRIFNVIFKSILAGVLIALAGHIYLNCSNKIVGAFLFSIGLIGVIVLKANLYTGKVGYIKSKQDIFDLLIILVVNLVSAYLVGLLVKNSYDLGLPYEARLLKSEFRIFLDGVFCGMLIYLAVELYKKTNSLIPVIMCVMAFILAGFEHSIADAYYMGVSELSGKGLLYMFLIVLGNAVGSLVVRHIQLLCEKYN